MPHAPNARWVKPQLHGDHAALSFGDVVFEADARAGGRITALRIGGRNLLTGPDIDPGNFGSTFWTSPQSGWGWPPVPEIDHQPYRPSIEGHAIVMRGDRSPTLNVEIEKRFSADEARGAIVTEFRIQNLGPSPFETAPWQITRVRPGGLTFFPTGGGVFPPSNLAVREAHGVTWYAYNAAAITSDQKLFADGREGWLAHVDEAVVFVKCFAPVARAQQAPGEAQIEIYASPSHAYVELEIQGAYGALASDAFTDWQVTWLVRRLPDGLDRQAGAAELVEHVRRVVSEANQNEG
jgi:uncharacterized protein DUF4380